MVGDDTRAALVDAAERIFARDGFERASLREIMREAGANPSAVHYHFNGKDGLLIAVLDRVVAPLTERRLELLAELRAVTPDGPLPLPGLVEAFLRPDIEAIAALQARGPGRAALVGRAYGQPTELVRELVARQFDPVGQRFFPEFFATLAPLDPEVVRWRLRWCVVGVIIGLFGSADQPDGPFALADPANRDGEGLESALARAVAFVVGGLEAPMA